MIDGLGCMLHLFDKSKALFPPGATLKFSFLYYSEAVKELQQFAIVRYPWQMWEDEEKEEEETGYYQCVTGVQRLII